MSENSDWLVHERMTAKAYISAQGVGETLVAEEPAIAIPPYLALWAVGSATAPGRSQWWVMTGDLPTDHISAAEARNARQAMRAFAEKWTAFSACMLLGEELPAKFAEAELESADLIEALESRAELLLEFANNNGMWAASGT